MTALSTPLPPPSGLMRWSVLALMSLALFGNYYAYDSIGPVADHLQRLDRPALAEGLGDPRRGHLCDLRRHSRDGR